jgi:hypothetical protein
MPMGSQIFDEGHVIKGKEKGADGENQAIAV